MSDTDPCATCIKGLPPAFAEASAETIGAQGWNLLREDLALPLAVLRDDALANNGRWMREFVARTGTLLAPHGKTTLSPELFRRQLDDGAWGITVSTVHHARIARLAGTNRILFANELVGRQEIGWVVAERLAAPAFEPLLLVDSAAGIARLATAAANLPAARRIGVMVEIGYAGGRCGVRDDEEALALARAVAAAPGLELRGIEGYEGLHQHLPAAEGMPGVVSLLDRIVAIAERADREGLFGDRPAILSAGGSAFYDVVAEKLAAATLRQSPELILRSGCYLTHDAGVYERSFGRVLDRSEVARGIAGRFENALEVWTYVISAPEPGRVILGAGRRDFGNDAGQPVLLKVFRPGRDTVPVAPPAAMISAANDQHAYVDLEAGGDLQVGDLVALGVSHPCTTFDKWRRILVVDGHYDVISAIRTCF